MTINLPKYTIASTIIYYDSIIERNIAFIYGLSTNTDTGYADLVKFPAGKYMTSYEPFFEYYNEDGTLAKDPWESHFPYNKSFIETKDFYCISSYPNTYFYYIEQPINNDIQIISGWTTDLSKTSYYFTKHSAEKILALLDPNIKDLNITTHNYIIKDFIINGAEFPCSTYIIDNFKDYNKKLEN